MLKRKLTKQLEKAGIGGVNHVRNIKSEVSG